MLQQNNMYRSSLFSLQKANGSVSGSQEEQEDMLFLDMLSKHMLCYRYMDILSKQI